MPSWALETKHDTYRRVNHSVAQKEKHRPVKWPNITIGRLAWGLPVMTLLAGFVCWWMGVSSAVLILPATVLGGILVLIGLFLRQSERTRNFSALAATGAFVTAISGVATQSGITLYTTDVAVLIASLALIVSWFLKSGPALMLSGLAGVIWLASLNPYVSVLLGFDTPVSQGWITLFPLLLAGQAGLAMTLRSRSIILILIASAYGFVATLGSNIPAPALAGLAFAGAAAHHRLGKAWADSGIFGARLHILSGWIAALVAAFYLQALWLNTETGPAVPLWQTSNGWWIALGFSALALFISSILRYKHAQITLFGIFLVSAATLILPIASVRPDIISHAFDTIPGLNAHPGFGFVIGAAMMASGLAWVVNGLRKGIILDMTLGVCLVGIQAVIILRPGLTSLDFGIVFIVSLISALCVSGLIAGTSLNHTPPAHRYA